MRRTIAFQICCFFFPSQVYICAYNFSYILPFVAKSIFFPLSYKLSGIMLLFSISFPGLLWQVALMQSFLEGLDPLQNFPSNTLS